MAEIREHCLEGKQDIVILVIPHTDILLSNKFSSIIIINFPRFLFIVLTRLDLMLKEQYSWRQFRRLIALFFSPFFFFFFLSENFIVVCTELSFC